MSQDNHEPSQRAQLIASALLSLILAIAIGGAVSSLKNGWIGLIAGVIAFLVVWALVFQTAKTQSGRNRN